MKRATIAGGVFATVLVLVLACDNGPSSRTSTGRGDLVRDHLTGRAGGGPPGLPLRPHHHR